VSEGTPASSERSISHQSLGPASSAASGTKGSASAAPSGSQRSLGSSRAATSSKASTITDALFTTIDLDSDGVISRTEFRGALKSGVIETGFRGQPTAA
jgi:hypothetical protein